LQDLPISPDGDFRIDGWKCQENRQGLNRLFFVNVTLNITKLIDMQFHD